MLFTLFILASVAKTLQTTVAGPSLYHLASTRLQLPPLAPAFYMASYIIKC